MWALLVSTLSVALAEMGDKTQLLTLLIGARYGRDKAWMIILGILCATLLNHFFAAYFGQWVVSKVGPEAIRWIIFGLFLVMAVWIMVPDKLDKEETPGYLKHSGVFMVTFVTFFLAEMGDKTQIATVALSAEFKSLTMVVIGTTLGMMIANVPAIYLGEAVLKRIPPRLMHGITACLFVAMAILALVA